MAEREPPNGNRTFRVAARLALAALFLILLTIFGLSAIGDRETARELIPAVPKWDSLQ